MLSVWWNTRRFILRARHMSHKFILPDAKSNAHTAGKTIDRCLAGGRFRSLDHSSAPGERSASKRYRNERRDACYASLSSLPPRVSWPVGRPNKTNGFLMDRGQTRVHPAFCTLLSGTYSARYVRTHREYLCATARSAIPYENIFPSLETNSRRFVLSNPFTFVLHQLSWSSNTTKGSQFIAFSFYKTLQFIFVEFDALLALGTNILHVFFFLLAIIYCKRVQTALEIGVENRIIEYRGGLLQGKKLKCTISAFSSGKFLICLQNVSTSAARNCTVEILLHPSARRVRELRNRFDRLWRSLAIVESIRSFPAEWETKRGKKKKLERKKKN